MTRDTQPEDVPVSPVEQSAQARAREAGYRALAASYTAEARAEAREEALSRRRRVSVT